MYNIGIDYTYYKLFIMKILGMPTYTYLFFITSRLDNDQKVP